MVSKQQRIFSLAGASDDISAGIVVFLVALPLCFGVASAAQVPLSAGLISAIIAGILVPWISGSALTIAAPATSLAVLVFPAIKSLGSFDAVLVGIFLAGLIQILLGLLKTGAFSSFFPHSVVKGMLSAVGFMMILKQIPHVLGWDADFIGDESFDAEIMVTPGNTFTDIYHAFQSYNVTAITVSVFSFAAFFAWRSPKITQNKYLAKIPAAVIAIAMGTIVHELIGAYSPMLALKSTEGHFMTMPTAGLASFILQIHQPDWSSLINPTTWHFAFWIAILGSVESLLTLEAADRFDPKHLSFHSNRELIAQGIGNSLCGLLGGLPLASGIIRSTANIYGGARSRLSGFIHGLLLIIAVTFIPNLLNHIPLAAFATLIIVVAAQLVRPAFLRDVYLEGPEQFLPFIVTIIAIVFSDLLSGIGIGLIVGWIIVIRMNHHSALTVVNDGSDILVRFAKDVTFAHKLALKKILNKIPQNSFVTIDGTRAHFIDHDILDVVREFRDIAPSRNISVNLKNLRSKRMSILGVMNGKLQEPFAGK